MPWVQAVFMLWLSVASSRAADCPAYRDGDYPSQLESLEEEVKLACANGQVGDLRAEMALQAMRHAECLGDGIKQSLGKVYGTLSSPGEQAEARFRENAGKELTLARVAAIEARDAYEFASLRGAARGDRTLASLRERHRLKLREAESRLSRARLHLSPPERIRSELSAEVSAAQERLRQYEPLVSRIDTAVSRSRGCYITATGRGHLTFPYNPENFEKNFLNARQQDREIQSESEGSSLQIAR